MTAWDLGMRARVGISGVFCLALGLSLLLQDDQQNSVLAGRLRMGWTPEMVGWAFLGLGLTTLVTVAVQNIPLAAIVCGSGGLWFALLTVAVWPNPDHSYWFPIFTLNSAVGQFASLGILAKDWGHR